MQKATEALSRNVSCIRSDSPESRLSDASEEEDAAMAEVAQMVGASDVQALAAIGQEGLEPAASGGRRSSSGTIQTLLEQLRKEPNNEAECTAKFLLYEGYASEVEEMRGTLLKFHEESLPTVPQAVAADMTSKVKSIDSTEAMGIPDDAREWFVFHMMRQAERNNLRMASILEAFEKKLEFLAANNQSECPVCLEHFAEGTPHAPETLGCCHKVCKDCWKNWTEVKHGRPFCPLCKHKQFLEELAAHASM